MFARILVANPKMEQGVSSAARLAYKTKEVGGGLGGVCGAQYLKSAMTALGVPGGSWSLFVGRSDGFLFALCIEKG